ncbi:MAG: type II toxin-antitoxin system HicB family antitoxin [Theionarchaea archaeon]|nr:type II toxin-antitoxin system HicB family antitoxin [Theionarchaea archaeon]
MLVKMEVYNDSECRCARGIGENIFTQGGTLDELINNIKKAVEVHFLELLERGEQIEIPSLLELEVELLS